MAGNQEFQIFDDSGYMTADAKAAAAADRASPVAVVVEPAPETAKRKPGRPKKVKAEPEAESQAKGGSPRWRVGLNCPTPIEHRTLVVEAGTQDEAKQKFCDANGISDSEHEFSYERVA